MSWSLLSAIWDVIEWFQTRHGNSGSFSRKEHRYGFIRKLRDNFCQLGFSQTALVHDHFQYMFFQVRKPGGCGCAVNLRQPLPRPDVGVRVDAGVRAASSGLLPTQGPVGTAWKFDLRCLAWGTEGLEVYVGTSRPSKTVTFQMRSWNLEKEWKSGKCAGIGALMLFALIDSVCS